MPTHCLCFTHSSSSSIKAQAKHILQKTKRSIYCRSIPWFHLWKVNLISLMDVRLAFDGSLRSPISWAVYTEPNLLSVVSQQQCYDLRFWWKLTIFPWNQFHENFRQDDFTENLCINIYILPATLILGYYMRRDRPSVLIGTIGAGFAIHSFVGLNGRHFWSRAKWSACLLKELSLRRSQVPILMTNS